MLIDTDLSLQTAIAVLNRLKEHQKEAVVAICDAHGELIVLLRTDNANLSSIQIASNKAYTAAREKKDTSEIGKILKDPDRNYDISFWGDARYTGFGGGIVIKEGNKVLGAIGVSGLPSKEDIEYAQFGHQYILQLMKK